jgi:hypothetical protein
MSHLLTGDHKFPDLTYDDAYRSYLITRTDTPGDYRFVRSQLVACGYGSGSAPSRRGHRLAMSIRSEKLCRKFRLQTVGALNLVTYRD